ncbi:gibberellin 2-beta-dioxygenase 8-like [Pistacia vera]|uniref:gibberellin 2-beta-dioxygenase 8-like n=1 Tax=Pistacia vera TaxID=55513 RepID=UPI0012630656|nr:gibberellin 2-beta-dioxygenase 8-like [Pistacia vera]
MSNLGSYPPAFRLQNKEQSQKYDPVDEEDSLDLIPLIDLQCINLDKLGEACKEWGLFRLVNHQVPLTLMNQLQEQAKKVFSLSFESKQRLFTSPVSYFWGTPALTPSGTALSRGPNNINWVEGFNVPLSQLSQFQADEDPMLHSFRLLLEEYGRHMGRLAKTLFEAMVKNLNLDSEESKSNLSESTGYVRAYRYPGLPETEALGMELHTDSSVLSILKQDIVGGLELFKDDKWFKVKPIPGTMIINLGDMMQAISNDEYMSAKHRVKTKKQVERFSICYFVFPEEGSVIRSSNYKPFTYSDFRAQVQDDIKTLGYKVGLERFKIHQD